MSEYLPGIPRTQPLETALQYFVGADLASAPIAVCAGHDHHQYARWLLPTGTGARWAQGDTEATNNWCYVRLRGDILWPSLLLRTGADYLLARQMVLLDCPLPYGHICKYIYEGGAPFWLLVPLDIL